MPMSHLLFDLETLNDRFDSEENAGSLTFDELRLVVARIAEAQRQLELASRKLGSVVSLTEAHIAHNRIDVGDEKPARNDHFPMHDSGLSGHDSIDEEHRELLALGNRVFAAACGDSPAAVREMLILFAFRVGEHFKNEEALMDAHGYPHADEHRSMHQRMSEYIGEMREVAAQQPITVAIKIERFLGSWFVWHMERDDAQFARYIASRRPN